MAIVVQHQPRLSTLANAGYVAGLGQYAAQQREFAQRQQSLDLAQAQAMDNAMLRRQQMALQNQAQMDANRRFGIQALQRQQQFDREMLQNQERLDLSRERNAAYQQQLQQNDPAMLRDIAWQQQSAQDVNKYANGIIADLSKLELNDTGLPLRKEMIGKYNAIQSMRGSIRPQEYMKKMEQWFNELEEKDIPSFEKKVPTLEEIDQQVSAFVRPLIGADKKEVPTAKVVINPKDGTMGIERFDLPENEEAKVKFGDQGASFAKWAVTDSDERDKMVSTIEKELRQEWASKPANIASDKEYNPSAEEIYKRLKRKWDIQQGVTEMAIKEEMGQAPQAPAQQPAPVQSVQDLQQQFDQAMMTPTTEGAMSTLPKTPEISQASAKVLDDQFGPAYQDLIKNQLVPIMISTGSAKSADDAVDKIVNAPTLKELGGDKEKLPKGTVYHDDSGALWIVH